MKKTSLFILFFLILLPETLLAKDTNTANTPKTVLVYGDSLSAAYNIKIEEGWVSLLQDFVDNQNLPVKMVNASISGETSSGGLERFAGQLKQTPADIVILELGGNDGLRGFDLQTTRDNLTQMINMSHAIGAKVVLAGIQLPPNMGRTYTRKFKQIYDDLGQLDDVILIPFILEGVATIDELMQRDGIHPNAKGQPVIMNNVWQYLSPLIMK
ncbi:arylesterase [Aliikangiella marina]|uniref:Arylesterase n=1 Tax=Aliikangiella marina TaxID=1712262 RepID=A0A545TEJ9_9GAMM|nr:arylesterase [Aliikangiella marina]TQV75596.1 arylesterase [Aliikangiella marina]